MRMMAIMTHEDRATRHRYSTMSQKNIAAQYEAGENDIAVFCNAVFYYYLVINYIGLLSKSTYNTKLKTVKQKCILLKLFVLMACDVIVFDELIR